MSLVRERPGAVVLGSAQDGGIPHVGCQCRTCMDAHAGRRVRYPASLAIANSAETAPRGAERELWLIDVTPSLTWQLPLAQQRLGPSRLVGALLTHAHMGHYGGLLQLGKEALNVRDFPIWVTDKMADFIERNEPWASLVRERNIVLNRLQFGYWHPLNDDIEVQPVRVRHRSELSDTIAVWLRSAERQIFYCPDIDTWEGFEMPLDDLLGAKDTAFLDCTFARADELRNRDINQVPHPLLEETVARFRNSQFRRVLTHFNHTNAVVDQHKSDGAKVRSLGFELAHEGDWYPL